MMYLRTNQRILACGSGLLCLLAGALANGYLSGRWTSGDALARAAAALENLPYELGPWRYVEDRPTDEKARQLLQAKTLIHRVYAHELSGAQVAVALIVGPTGPISTHSPEVCYSSQAFDFDGELERIDFEADSHVNNQLWARTFISLQAGTERLRVYWGWYDSQSWRAPQKPRWDLVGAPYLCKLQAAAPVPPQVDVAKYDPARDFLRELLGVVKDKLEPLATTSHDPN